MDWLWITGLVVVVIPLFIWGAVSPRSQWRVLNGWTFRHPDKVEPSDAMYIFVRVGSIVMLSLFAAAGVFLFTILLGEQRTAACRDEILPQAEALAGDPTESQMEQIAQEHSLELRSSQSLDGFDLPPDVDQITTFELYDGNRHVFTARANAPGFGGLPRAECH